MTRKLVRSMMIAVAVAGGIGAGSVFAQNTTQQMMPYTTVDHPQFIPASQATFLSDNDLLIGISHGEVAKAYPAADLAQHGVVQDQMAGGLIAITW
jgi:Protein of unknown function (DUF3179)